MGFFTFKWDERKRFEFVLTIIVFVLTISSSIISGYSVYYLTLDRNPSVMVSLESGNSTGFIYKIQALNDNPVRNVIFTYKIDNINVGEAGTIYPSISSRDKGEKSYFIDKERLDSFIINYYEEQVRKLGIEEGISRVVFVKSSEEKKGVISEYRIYDLPEYFIIQIIVSCKDCILGKNLIIQPEVIIYDISSITCFREEVIECRIESSGITYDWNIED